MMAALSPRSEPERFAVQLASAADPAALGTWLEDAAIGDRAQYAAGLDLPRTAAGVQLVSGWKDKGLVRTFAQRDPLDRRRWLYLAEKISDGRGPSGQSHGASGPLAAIPSKPPGRQRATDTLRAEQADLIRMLREAAAQGQPCPSLRDIARRVRCGSGERGRRRARYLLELTARQGRIKLEMQGRLRVVTVLVRGRGYGCSTAGGSA